MTRMTRVFHVGVGRIKQILKMLCQYVPGSKVANIRDGRPPTFNRNPYNGYINPYYWVDDHPLLYGNNGSLDPGTYDPMKAMGEVMLCRL